MKKFSVPIILMTVRTARNLAPATLDQVRGAASGFVADHLFGRGTARAPEPFFPRLTGCCIALHDGDHLHFLTASA